MGLARIPKMRIFGIFIFHPILIQIPVVYVRTPSFSDVLGYKRNRKGLTKPEFQFEISYFSSDFNAFFFGKISIFLGYL